MSLCWFHQNSSEDRRQTRSWSDQTKSWNTCSKVVLELWVWLLFCSKHKKTLNQAECTCFVPLLCAPAVSFHRVPSERAVGVSAILLAARCHPFQCCSIKNQETLYDTPAKELLTQESSGRKLVLLKGWRISLAAFYAHGLQPICRSLQSNYNTANYGLSERLKLSFPFLIQFQLVV